MSIEMQVWSLAGLFAILVMFICYQTWWLGRLVRGRRGGRAAFGVIEIMAWMVMLGLRLNNLRSVSPLLSKVKERGIIRTSLLDLPTEPVIIISAQLVFLILIIISKHLEYRAFKRAWGI